MTLYSSAADQHRMFSFQFLYPYIWKLPEDWDSPCKPWSWPLPPLLLCQLCWAHAALQVSMQHLFHCFFLQAWELLRAPEKIWFEIQQYQYASHKCQQSWREATCGAAATLPCIWAISPEHLHFILLLLIGLWAVLRFALENMLLLQANAVAMQGDKGGTTQWAKPHTGKCGTVYLDFGVERKDVLSSIISAQFV